MNEEEEEEEKPCIKWCGCGDELQSEEDNLTKMCGICRSIGRVNLPAAKLRGMSREGHGQQVDKEA